jgi:hypothetical protein
MLFIQNNEKQNAQMMLHVDYDFIQDNQENKYKPLNLNMMYNVQNGDFKSQALMKSKSINVFFGFTRFLDSIGAILKT